MDAMTDPIRFTKEPEKILIIKPSAWGDIVHSLPFLAVVKKRYPKCEIHWVIAKGLHTFLEGHPLIHKLWIMDKDGWKDFGRIGKSLTEMNAFRRGLKKERFDISIDLSGLLRSGLISWAAAARYRLGFSDSDEGSPFFYSHKIKGGDQIHAIDRYLLLADLIDCDTSEITYPFPPLPDITGLLSTLPEQFCIMVPSAGKKANRWPAKRFAALAARLHISSLVIAGDSDKDIAGEVVAGSQGKAINLAGKTGLKELVALTKRASFFICNDTGPMHIAAALEIPLFALFGPANPVRTGPYGKNSTVIRVPLDCSPCYAQKPCTQHNWRCMNELTVDTVYEHITDRLNLNSSQRNHTEKL